MHSAARVSERRVVNAPRGGGAFRPSLRRGVRSKPDGCAGSAPADRVPRELRDLMHKGPAVRVDRPQTQAAVVAALARLCRARRNPRASCRRARVRGSGESSNRTKQNCVAWPTRSSRGPCPLLVEGDIRAPESGAGFDPERASAVKVFCVARFLFDHLICAQQD
jgi:hypothetical protein